MLKTFANSIYGLNYFVLASLLLMGGCSWQKNPQKPLALAQPSIVKASISSLSRRLSKNYACFNVNSLLVKSWLNPEFQQAAKQVNPKLLRIPGGTESNYWDWQKGGLIENVREEMAGYPINFRDKDLEYDSSKLENIQVGIKETNTVPIFVLNLATSTLESQLEMLRIARDLGMPIEYIELGNEFYFDVPNYKKVFPTPVDYAETASEWISAIKQEFPAAKISLVGVAAKAKDSIREQNWQQSLLGSAINKADAVTLHIYNGHGLKSQIDSNSNYPFFSSEEVPLILGQPFRNWKKLQNNPQLGLIPDNKQIWITEYNLFENVFGKKNQGKQQRVMGSWVHGLYTLTMSLLFLEDSRVEIACNHVLIGNSRFAAIFANKKSFHNPSDENMMVTPKSLSATGSTLSLLGEATSGMTQAQKIDFSSVPTLVGKKDFEYPALYGWKFNDGTNSQAIIINLSNQDINVNLEQLFSSSISYQQFAENPQTLITGSEVLKVKSGNVFPEIILPAYSVTKLGDKNSTSE
ncbi:MAG: hypothetical protein QNJ53_20415 [Pleurocapsa sp. MO_192.B19]|nr:hypothetical protein [Pleurocapsa sp. MO_192.B19]